MAKAEEKNPMLGLLESIAAQVDDLTRKRKIADEAELAYNKANSELSQATARLQELRNQMHETLGGTLNDVGRVRQTN